MKKVRFNKKSIDKVVAFTCGAVLAASACATALFAPVHTSYADEAGDEHYISQGREYLSADDYYNAEIDLNIEMCEEGFVLMKNDDNYLPLKKADNDGAKYKVSMFGNNAYEYAYFGFGSSDNSGIGALPNGGVWDDAYAATKELYQAIQESDTFELNPTLRDFYLDKNKSGNIRLNGNSHDSLDGWTAGLDVGETPIERYTDDVKASFDNYNDLAIVVITRPGAEGADLAKTSLKSWNDLSNNNKLDNARDWQDHALQLDKNEVAMFQMVLQKFDNVVVLINTTSQFEVGFLDDPDHYLFTDNGFATTDEQKQAYMDKIKSAMFIGFPGRYGAIAVPRVLDGTANPSGKLADTWMRDFKEDPTWQNQGYNGNRNLAKSNGDFVHYDEDIYLGYRYYETRYITEGTDGVGDEQWYNDQVVYPFGYGMSYTQFKWSEVQISTTGDALSKNGKITASVKVTNTGSVAGKDVVQLYYSAPYYDGGIEKAHVELANFGKTKLLNSGESEVITMELAVSDMKSYDWADKNKNGFKGYELEHGDYDIVLARDSHDAAQLPAGRTETFNLAEDVKYDKDPETGADVGNLFDNVSVNEKGVQVYMSRSDFEGTFPTSGLDKLDLPRQGKRPYVINEDTDKESPWYSEEEFTQATMPHTKEENEVMLWHLRGRDYDDPLWDELLNQLTIEEMAELIDTTANFETRAIPSIDKPLTKENDGPLGNRFCVSIQWQSAVLSAQTFNRELLYRQGRLFGNGCMYPLNNNAWGGTYGPGIETHRSPFGGRNMEYYSEDPILGGYICAEFMRGAWDIGSYQILKHFVMNNCETERGSVSTWASEQAIREIYARAYEIVVKEGNCVGMMSAVSYLGDMVCTTNWELLTGLLRNEWGFKGFVISDAGIQDVELSIRSGNDLMLQDNNFPSTDPAKLTTTQRYHIRKSAKNILYVVANSLAMNGLGGRALSGIEYVGPSKLYAVGGSEVSDLSVGTATFKRASNNKIKYSLLSGMSLPAGLTLNADGTITGTPTAPGKYTFTVVAEEDVDASVEFPYVPQYKTYELTVFDGDNLPEDIVYEEVNLGVIPYGFNYSISIANAVAVKDGIISTNATYKLKEGSKLPAGLKLENGVISGVANEAPGGFFFTIVISHEGFPDRECNLFCTIVSYDIGYQTKELPELKVGSAIQFSIADATVEGGKSVYYTLKSTTPLPEGLTLKSDGTISGTPTRAYDDYKFTVIASAEGARPVEATYSLDIKGLVFKDTTFDGLILSKQYELKLSAYVNDGSDGHISFRLKSGSNLPTGFVLLEDGTLIGTAQDLGNVSFTVEAITAGQAIAEARITLVMHDIYEDEYDENAAIGPIVEPNNNENSGLSAGAIAGIVVPICVVVIAGVVVFLLFYFKKISFGKGSKTKVEADTIEMKDSDSNKNDQ